jgi:hypothetical protein
MTLFPQLFALQKFCSRILPRVIAGYKDSKGAHFSPWALSATNASLCRCIPPRGVPRRAGFPDPSGAQSYIRTLDANSKLTSVVSRNNHVDSIPNQLMPILLRGLDLQDTELRINIFETLLLVAKEAADVVGSSGSSPLVEHAGSLVKASLANTQLSETITSVWQAPRSSNRSCADELFSSESRYVRFSCSLCYRIPCATICSIRIKPRLSGSSVWFWMTEREPFARRRWTAGKCFFDMLLYS